MPKQIYFRELFKYVIHYLKQNSFACQNSLLFVKTLHLFFSYCKDHIDKDKINIKKKTKQLNGSVSTLED